ncbi:hypothetical protein POM88_021289 [Heracleum sosnowskyi]|uniref:Uncharacterized protein n=1 Tax=Heracleum sosnowskyi TaxID=360622 RepID=A0AAD8MSQ9_9APIA|nr:hypothetical protein POM88_021289 [Heracleum sosnowskyi]
MNSTEYWEILYPGWKYDQNTGQWYQVDGYDEKAALTLMFIMEQWRFLLATNLLVWCRDNTAKWYLKQLRAPRACQTRIRFRQVKHSLSNQVSQRNYYEGSVPSNKKASQSLNEFSNISEHQSFISGGNFTQQYNQPQIKTTENMHTSNNYYDNQNVSNYSQLQCHSGNQFTYASAAGANATLN